LKTYLDIDKCRAERSWPNLELDNHYEASPKDNKYNCYAWALNKNNEKWAPYTGYSWFKGFKKVHQYPGEDINLFIEGFASIGYDVCDNSNLENGFEKIAFYIKGKGVEHIARQLENGTWASKLGVLHDIEHDNLSVLEDGEYGKAILFMKRKRVVKIIQYLIKLLN